MSSRAALLLCLLLVGCKTTPGFEVGWKITVPPTMNNNTTVPLVPTPTAMGTSYLIDAAGPPPVSERRYYMPSPPVAAENPLAVQPPVHRQLLPMPRENAPVPPQKPMPGACGE